MLFNHVDKLALRNEGCGGFPKGPADYPVTDDYV
jgi:hypothetical protein